MANISLTIPDAQVQRVIDALCARGLGNPPIPVDPTAANAKAVVISWVKQQVADYEAQQAIQALPVVDVTTLVT